MEITRALALKLLKRDDWGRAPATPRTRRSALTLRRQRAEKLGRDPRRPG